MASSSQIDHGMATNMDQVHEPREAGLSKRVSPGRLCLSGPVLGAEFLRGTIRLKQSKWHHGAMVGMTRAGRLIRDRAGPCAYALLAKHGYQVQRPLHLPVGAQSCRLDPTLSTRLGWVFGIRHGSSERVFIQSPWELCAWAWGHATARFRSERLCKLPPRGKIDSKVQ